MPIPLPIDRELDQIVLQVRNHPITIVHAPPGSGKTTRVAPALMRSSESSTGKRIYLLQPRRLAARSVAMRIAHENQWELGGEVGYHVRFERKYGRDTRLIVATEGVLLRRLQDDPTLTDTSIVLMDEFHERSLDTDLLFGMLKEVQSSVREDLRLVIMSATLDRESLIRELGQVPIVSVDGQMYPVSIRYRPLRFKQTMPEAMTESVVDAYGRHPGDILAFLPGQGEIHRVRDALDRSSLSQEADIYPLYGSLSLDEQTRIIQPGSRRKIVLATNVAETSLTIEGIRVVVDSGQARIMRFDPSVGLDRLNIEPITLDSATQRTGRAGRVAEGHCYRLWDEASHRARPEHLEPEVRRIDLAGAVLQLYLWGQNDPMKFAWLTSPREEAVTAAIRLLERLGAVRGKRLTELGRQLARLPLHPRLARMVIDGYSRGHLRSVALAAAMLSERDPFQNREPQHRSTSSRGGSIHTSQARRWQSDVAIRVELLEAYLQNGESETVLGKLHRSQVQPIVQAARDIETQVLDSIGVSSTDDPSHRSDLGKIPSTIASSAEEEALMRALLSGFPDRLAKRRGIGKNTALMVGGRAVQVLPSSGVHDAELFVCIDVDGRGTDASVRQASAVEYAWLEPSLLDERDELFFHPTQQQVVARRRILWDDLILSETPVAVQDRQKAAELLYQAAINAWQNVFPNDDQNLQSLVERCRWLRSVLPNHDLPDLSIDALQEVCRELCDQYLSFAELKKGKWYDWVVGRLTGEQKQLLDREAPERIQVPSGSSIRLEYELGKPPILPVKIQEVFSWKSTPRLAMGQVPILLHLLAPNMRPQQITDDLASFWATGYAIVKKDLKRRYPKHSWPDDPTTASPSKR